MLISFYNGYLCKTVHPAFLSIIHRYFNTARTDKQAAYRAQYGKDCKSIYGKIYLRNPKNILR